MIILMFGLAIAELVAILIYGAILGGIGYTFYLLIKALRKYLRED